MNITSFRGGCRRVIKDHTERSLSIVFTAKIIGYNLLRKESRIIGDIGTFGI
jgi:hypothetical protein